MRRERLAERLFFIFPFLSSSNLDNTKSWGCITDHPFSFIIMFSVSVSRSHLEKDRVQSPSASLLTMIFIPSCITLSAFPLKFFGGAVVEVWKYEPFYSRPQRRRDLWFPWKRDCRVGELAPNRPLYFDSVIEAQKDILHSVRVIALARVPVLFNSFVQCCIFYFFLNENVSQIPLDYNQMLLMLQSIWLRQFHSTAAVLIHRYFGLTDRTSALIYREEHGINYTHHIKHWSHRNTNIKRIRQQKRGQKYFPHADLCLKHFSLLQMMLKLYSEFSGRSDLFFSKENYQEMQNSEPKIPLFPDKK